MSPISCWVAGCQKEKERLKEQARILREELRKLFEKNRKLREKSGGDNFYIKELSNKIKKFEKAVSELAKMADYYKGEVKRVRESMNRPSLSSAIFVRPHPEGKPDEIDILSEGQLMKVALAVPGLAAKDLKCGWQVFVNAKGNVVEVIMSYWPWGSEVTLKELISEDLALVTSDNAVAQCFLSPELKNVQLKVGDSLLNCRGLLVKVLPKSEGKEHFLDIEEITNVDWSKVGGLSKVVKKIQRTLLPFKERDVYVNILKCKNMPR